jgi:hypothetical protein
LGAQPALRERRVTADPRTIPPVTASDSISEPISRSESDQPTALRKEHSGDISGPSAAENQAAGRSRIWLRRLRALLFVTLCATFGVLLLILPWTPKWTDNPRLLSSPGLRDFVSSGFVRGFASGLGLLDLWLGFREAILYHENPKGSGQ